MSRSCPADLFLPAIASFMPNWFSVLPEQTSQWSKIHRVKLTSVKDAQGAGMLQPWGNPMGTVSIFLGLIWILKTIFPGMAIPVIKMRPWWDRLAFIMGYPLLVKWHLYIETAPGHIATGTTSTFYWPFRKYNMISKNLFKIFKSFVVIIAQGFSSNKIYCSKGC